MLDRAYIRMFWNLDTKPIVGHFVLKTAILAILVAVIYMGPHLLFIREMGIHYRGIVLMGSSDEEFYVSRIARVMNGDYRFGDHYFYEHRHDPWVQPPFPEILLGTIGRYLGISVSNFVILMDAILPALTAVLASIFLFQVTGHPTLSVLGAATLMLGNGMPRVPDLAGVIRGHRPAEPLIFSRPVQPHFPVNLLLLCIIVIYRAIQRDGYRWPVLTGIAFGTLFYTYMYYWTFIAVGLCILTTWHIVSGERVVVRRLFVVLGVGAIISLPFWIHMVHVMQHPHYIEMTKRLGLVPLRSPILSKLLLVGIPIFALYYRGQKLVYSLMLCFMLAGLILYNQHVVTGRYLQPGHWHWYAVKPWLVFASFALMADWVNRERLRATRFISKPLLGKLAVIVFIVILLANAGYVQLCYVLHADKYRAYQRLMPVFEWLETYDSAGDVVLASDTVSRLLPVYTTKNVYITDYTATPFLVSTSELQHHRLIAWRLYGVHVADVENYTNRYSLPFFGMYYRELYGKYVVPPEELKHLVLQYIQIQSMPLEQILSTYRLDYILLSPYERSEFGADESFLRDNFQLVYNDGYTLVFLVLRGRSFWDSHSYSDLGITPVDADGLSESDLLLFASTRDRTEAQLELEQGALK